MEARYIEKLKLDDMNLVKKLRNDPLMTKYKSLYVKYDTEDYPKSKIMSTIKSASSRNKNLDKLSDDYLVSHFYGSKNRILIMNKIVNPYLNEINDYYKYSLNIRILELQQKINQYKAFLAQNQKLIKKFLSVSKNKLAKKSIETTSSLLKYLLYDINNQITLIEHDLKLDNKINKVLQASYICMLKDYKQIEKEADLILKSSKLNSKKNILTDTSEPVTLLQKLVAKKSETTVVQTSNQSSGDSSKPEHAYMTDKKKPTFDPQLGNVKNKIFGGNKRKNYNNNNNNNNYGKGNNNNSNRNNKFGNNNNNYSNNNNNRFGFRNNNNNNYKQNNYRNNNNNGYRKNNYKGNRNNNNYQNQNNFQQRNNNNYNQNKQQNYQNQQQQYQQQQNNNQNDILRFPSRIDDRNLNNNQNQRRF